VAGIAQRGEIGPGQVFGQAGQFGVPVFKVRGYKAAQLFVYDYFIRHMLAAGSRPGAPPASLLSAFRRKA
jgi:hypothetical protein